MSSSTGRPLRRPGFAVLVVAALVPAAIGLVTPAQAQSEAGPLGNIVGLLNEILTVLRPAPAPVVLSTGVGFALGIDQDLVAAAAEGAPQEEPRHSACNIDQWLAMLDTTEHVGLLSRVARGDGSVGADLVRRFRRRIPSGAAALPRRTVGELRTHATAIAEKPRKAAREREARERAARQREEQAARERLLTYLAKRERQAWQRVDTFIGTRRPGDYAAAVELLVDLRDLSERKGRAGRSRSASARCDWRTRRNQVCARPPPGGGFRIVADLG